MIGIDFSNAQTYLALAVAHTAELHDWKFLFFSLACLFYGSLENLPFGRRSKAFNDDVCRLVGERGGLVDNAALEKLLILNICAKGILVKV